MKKKLVPLLSLIDVILFQWSTIQTNLVNIFITTLSNFFTSRNCRVCSQWLVTFLLLYPVFGVIKLLLFLKLLVMGTFAIKDNLLVLCKVFWSLQLLPDDQLIGFKNFYLWVVIMEQDPFIAFCLFFNAT